MTDKLPDIRADVALIDMDGTVTPTIKHGDYCGRVLCRLVAQRHGVDEAGGESIVRQTFDLGEEPITDSALSDLRIEYDEYWKAVMTWQDAHFSPFEDAVEMIKRLGEMNVRMYPGTSNSSFACRVKLAMAGLAGPRGPTHFAELFGGSEVCPDGKSGPGFFSAILEKIDCAAKDVVMIGDEVTTDLAFARSAGIEQIVIVHRDQERLWLRGDDGAIFVRSLAIVPQMLGRTSDEKT